MRERENSRFCSHIPFVSLKRNQQQNLSFKAKHQVTPDSMGKVRWLVLRLPEFMCLIFVILYLLLRDTSEMSRSLTQKLSEVWVRDVSYILFFVVMQ